MPIRESNAVHNPHHPSRTPSPTVHRHLDGSRVLTVGDEDLGELYRRAYPEPEGCVGGEQQLARWLVLHDKATLISGERLWLPSHERLVAKAQAGRVSERAVRAAYPEAYHEGWSRGHRRAEVRKEQDKQRKAEGRQAIAPPPPAKVAAPRKVEMSIEAAGRFLLRRIDAVVGRLDRKQLEHPSVLAHALWGRDGAAIPAAVRDALLRSYPSLEQLAQEIDASVRRRAPDIAVDGRTGSMLADLLAKSYFVDRALRPVRATLERALRAGASHFELVARDRAVAMMQIAALRTPPASVETVRVRLAGLRYDRALANDMLSGSLDEAASKLQAAARLKSAEVERLIGELPARQAELFNVDPALTERVMALTAPDFDARHWDSFEPRTAAEQALAHGFDAYDRSEEVWAQAAVGILGSAVATTLTGGATLVAMACAAVAGVPGLLAGYAQVRRTGTLEAAGRRAHGSEVRAARALWASYAFGIAATGVIGAAEGHELVGAGARLVEEKLGALTKDLIESAASEVVARTVTGLLYPEQEGAGAVLEAEAALAERYGLAAIDAARVDLRSSFERALGPTLSRRFGAEAYARALHLYCAVAGEAAAERIARGELEGDFEAFVRTLGESLEDGRQGRGRTRHKMSKHVSRSASNP